jgi:hypothetical protein
VDESAALVLRKRHGHRSSLQSRVQLYLTELPHRDTIENLWKKSLRFHSSVYKATLIAWNKTETNTKSSVITALTTSWQHVRGNIQCRMCCFRVRPCRVVDFIFETSNSNLSLITSYPQVFVHPHHKKKKKSQFILTNRWAWQPYKKLSKCNCHMHMPWQYIMTYEKLHVWI